MPAPVAILQTEQCPTWKDTKRTEVVFHSHSFARFRCVGVCQFCQFHLTFLWYAFFRLLFLLLFRYRCSVQCIEITLIVADKSSLINNRAKKTRVEKLNAHSRWQRDKSEIPCITTVFSLSLSIFHILFLSLAHINMGNCMSIDTHVLHYSEIKLASIATTQLHIGSMFNVTFFSPMKRQNQSFGHL